MAIPQFVADWIEESKKRGCELCYTFELNEEMPINVRGRLYRMVTDMTNAEKCKLISSIMTNDNTWMTDEEISSKVIAMAESFGWREKVSSKKPTPKQQQILYIARNVKSQQEIARLANATPSYVSITLRNWGGWV